MSTVSNKNPVKFRLGFQLTKFNFQRYIETGILWEESFVGLVTGKTQGRKHRPWQPAQICRYRSGGFEPSSEFRATTALKMNLVPKVEALSSWCRHVLVWNYTEFLLHLLYSILQFSRSSTTEQMPSLFLKKWLNFKIGLLPKKSQHRYIKDFYGYSFYSDREQLLWRGERFRPGREPEVIAKSAGRNFGR
jgi:hypothetical protein